ncbi:MAG: single-stranded-DNA-specific exonuclease RecJ [Flavobacteriales bacterium]|nr:single-stranded-DNA-specific exonuclease RecJ [Flavobacteriales bacterium]
MPNIWKKSASYSPEYINSISEKLTVNHFYATLLLNRGIASVDDARAFFNPDIAHLHDPFLMKDMQKAVERIDQALNNDEKVWVYGDYDVDGTTSVAMMFGFLRQFIPNIEYYIPNRETEGYGVSELAIDLAIEKKVNLIITLDCGIRSVELVKKAKDNSIDFVICDHHEPGEDTPVAVAVLDAKQPDCRYPYKELSACGVGFKLIQALCIKWDCPMEMAYDYLDLVAVSIASDLVPITGENRILASVGLKKLSENPSRGLQIIMQKFMQNRSIDITNVVFMIGPRINAAGRMANGTVAVQLLLADMSLDLEELAQNLNEYNTLRRKLDTETTHQALDFLALDEHYKNKKTTVVAGNDWHKGVVGIVASRLIETHYKPTIVLTKSRGKYVGSARSVADFDIHEALINCSEYLEKFGGHKFAAGLTLLPEHLEKFMEAFEKQASSLTEEDLTPVILYESEISLASIGESLFQNINRFAPFGPQNMKPVFLTKKVQDTGNARTMGEGHNHLKMNVISADCNQAIGATAFGFGQLYPLIKDGKSFDMLYTIEENIFNGNRNLQLMVKDIRVVE